MQSFRRHRQGLLSTSAIPTAVLLLMVGGVLILRLLAPDTFYGLLAPLSRAGTHVGAALKGPQTQADEALEAENRRLMNENEHLRARLAESDGVSTDDTIAAGVIARPPLSPYDVLIIGVGSAQGVREGSLVFAESVPVGRVANVSARTARVVLYSSAGYETHGWVGEERLPIIMRGKGAGAFDAEVARDAAIAQGDIVYLPGPGALPMGTVTNVEVHSSAPRASVSIRPLVNPFTLTYVSVHFDSVP